MKQSNNESMSSGFFGSFRPILKRFTKFKIELFLLGTAFFIAIISAVVYIYDNKDRSFQDETVQESVLSATTSRIVVDIAGAVESPGVYEATSGARLKDILIQAGGLSKEAEREYIARNFNLAKLVTDQEKIYVPSLGEISSGIFVEPQKFLDYTLPVTQENPAVKNSNTGKININRATLEELDTLVGIGKITAEKIIQNRPYESIEELLIKKIVKKNVYENIRNLIIH